MKFTATMFNENSTVVNINATEVLSQPPPKSVKEEHDYTNGDLVVTYRHISIVHILAAIVSTGIISFIMYSIYASGVGGNFIPLIFFSCVAIYIVVAILFVFFWEMANPSEQR